MRTVRKMKCCKRYDRIKDMMSCCRLWHYGLRNASVKITRVLWFYCGIQVDDIKIPDAVAKDLTDGHMKILTKFGLFCWLIVAQFHHIQVIFEQVILKPGCFYADNEWLRCRWNVMSFRISTAHANVKQIQEKYFLKWNYYVVKFSDFASSSIK